VNVTSAARSTSARRSALWYGSSVKQRVRFEELAPCDRSEATFVASNFGRRCVCCNADAMGRTQDCDSAFNRATPVSMPVCLACKDHAIQVPFVPLLPGGMLASGFVLFAIGMCCLIGRPHDHVLWGMLASSAALFGASLLWLRASSRRNRREQIGGHHPWLEFSTQHGALLDTTNEELVREVLAHNPNARLLPEPPLWRLHRLRQMPAARVVRSRDR